MVWRSLSDLSYFREYPNKSLIIESTSELSSLWGCLVLCFFFFLYLLLFFQSPVKIPPSLLLFFFFNFLTKQIVGTSSRRDLWSGSVQISLITGIFSSFSQGSTVGCVHIAPGKRKNISWLASENISLNLFFL